MRKTLISLAVAGAAMIAAAPASAQYYPAPQPAPYGYNNGFRGDFGQFRALQQRIDNVQRQIARLDRRDRLGDRTADKLQDEARNIERRLHDRARGGLDPREAGEIQFRIQRLEERVQIALANHHPRDRWDRRY